MIGSARHPGVGYVWHGAMFRVLMGYSQGYSHVLVGGASEGEICSDVWSWPCHAVSRSV
jgi:hypothetical protein